MRTLTLIAAAIALLAASSVPAAAGETDSLNISVVVLASCIVDAEVEEERAAPRVLCNTDAQPSAGDQANGERAREVAPLVETLERPGGAVVRVTY